MRGVLAHERVSRLRVGQWLAITFGALLAFAALALGFALVANHRLDERRTELLDRVGPSLRAAIALEGALLNEETGIRGYALAGQNGFLAPYRGGRATEEQAFATLNSLVGSTDVAPQIARVRAASLAWRRELVEPVLRMPAATLPGPVGLTARGKALFNSVRVQLAALQSRLQVKDNAVRLSLNRAANLLEALLIGAAALIVVSVVAAGLVLRAIVTRPLSKLEADATAVAAGDFSRPLTDAGGAREIVDLRDEIEAMRERIVHQLDSVQTAHELLGRQAIELRRSNAELDQFASVAAHDLQEPLRKIASFCQALQLHYEGRLDERADQYIEYAVDGAKRMQALITALHELARVGREAEHADVPLDEVLAGAERSLAGELGESGGRVVAEPLPTVRGDAALLSSLFQNLIGNAIKFHDSRAPVVRVGCMRGVDTWELSFADNGIGIDPQYGERIFQVFQRLHTRDAYDGTGIGLALCRKIVEYHGGRIWLDPEYAEGARFLVTLPINEPSSSGDMPSPSEDVPSPSKGEPSPSEGGRA
jgi:signal transduction histidine kinase